MPDKKTTRTKSGGTKPASSKPAAAKSASAKPAPRKPATGQRAAATTGGTKPTPAKSATAKSAGSTKTPATPAATEASPLHRKLRLRSEDKGLIVAPPPDADNPLLPLPEGFAVVEQPSELASHKGPFDYIHVFARDRVELTETLSLLAPGLAPTGSLWVSWMKPRSRLKGGGQPGDLNESIVRRIGLTRGFVDMNLAALDRDWGALRLVRRK